MTNPPGIRTSRPASIARFSSTSEIAFGFVKLLFNNVIAACKSPSPNESSNCSTVGDADGDDDADLAGAGGGLFVGVAEGDGVCASAFAATKTEMAIAAELLNIGPIVSQSSRREQYRTDNGIHRSE